MIARGKHIPTINESYSIRKSDGGMVIDSGAPYNACSGVDNVQEIKDALRPGFRADIEAEIQKRQERQ